ncbi:MAG: SGNH/GDSL hydrolase family protein [Blautia sp.]|nr:SGNH/GDSL hydrolase family protein [Blautia sp.]
MKKRIQIRIIVYGIVSAALFGALWLMTFPLRKVEKEYAPRIVMLGDSICGQVRDGTAISEYLARLSGQEVYNGALGGTCCSRIETAGRTAFTKDSLSFVTLSRAAALDDFGSQRTTIVRENATEYFPEVIETLEKTDFSEVDVLLALYGVNDYHSGVPLDDPGDPHNEYTFGGALRRALSFWQEAYPDTRIVLLTSTYAWYTGETGKTCEEKDYGGGILEDYVNKEIQVAEEMGVEVLDLYHDFYPHETWEDWMIYTGDGLHPNDAGRQLIAETIAAYLNQ